MGCCGLAQGVCSRKASSAAVRKAFEDMAGMAPRGKFVEVCEAGALVSKEICPDI